MTKVAYSPQFPIIHSLSTVNAHGLCQNLVQKHIEYALQAVDKILSSKTWEKVGKSVILWVLNHNFLTIERTATLSWRI